MDTQNKDIMTDVKNVVESNDMGTWTLELFDGQPPRMIGSDKMYDIIGFSNHKLTPDAVFKEWYSRITPDALQSVLEHAARMKKGERDENTYKWNHPTLGIRNICCGGTGTYFPGKGYIIRGYSYDITDQMHKVDEKNIILKSLAETYMCLFYLDLNRGTYVSYNNTLATVRHYISDHGWISVGLENFPKYLVKPEYSQAIREFVDLSTIDARMRYKNCISTRALGVDNIWFEVSFIVCARTPRGTISQLIMGIRDIGDQVREETMQKEVVKQNVDANNNKTAFLQNMTHEIRTPLNAMFGFAQLLSMPDGTLSDTEKTEFFNHIYNSYNMLTMLIDDVLDLADASHGNYRTIIESVHVNEVCLNAVNMTKLRKAENVNMYCTSDVDDTYTIQSDSKRIQQLLVNYLSNACKHTSEGEIHLHVSTTETPGRLTFSVTDTGEGIPADQAVNIFQRFKKLNLDAKGSGLGLNICSIIAEKLGGSVSLDTNYTNGARFLFIL